MNKFAVLRINLDQSIVSSWTNVFHSSIESTPYKFTYIDFLTIVGLQINFVALIAAMARSEVKNTT